MSDLPQDLPPKLGMSSDQKLMVILCHISIFIGVGIILPLIIYLVKKDNDQIVRKHAAESLNFQLSFLIYAIACIPLVFILIGVPLMFVIIIVEFVLAILGTIKASENVVYNYPMTIRMVS